MGKLYCHGCGEVYETRQFKPERTELRCDCGAMRSTFRKPTGEQWSTLKPSKKGFAASDAQREKVADAPSIISAVGPCDPMHIWDRRLGGCDDPLCVVPATRAEHNAYERKELDILPALIAGGYFAELAHVIEKHQVSPTRLLEQLTGQRFGPIGPLEARVFELEYELEAVSANG
jgi:hypothetical protein